MPGIPHRRPRPLPLAFIISSIFGVTATNSASALTLLVTDCSDGPSTGTLRNTITAAPDNSIVQIPLMCSKITLDQGHIAIPPAITNISIAGQSPSETIIEASSTSFDRLFVDLQPGTLIFSQLTLQKGHYAGNANPVGGCVYSLGNVALTHSVVTGCEVEFLFGSNVESKGGAIYARGSVGLLYSEVSNSRAVGGSGDPGLNALGGGIFSGAGLSVTSSTISGNKVQSGYHAPASRGGGFFVAGTGSTDLTRSTISNNVADVNSAGEVRTSGTSLRIVSSTIANNYSYGSQTFATFVPTTIINSTIAENTAAVGGSDFPAGLFSTQAITMYNSIFANNVAATGFSGDVYSVVGLIGDHNLITASSNSVPFKTISNCPKLGHLSSNGGLTQTIPLLNGSPAIDVGSANGQTTDQRGNGFPRTVGARTDIGAYERQASVIDDVIFFSEFESRCD